MVASYLGSMVHDGGVVVGQGVVVVTYLGSVVHDRGEIIGAGYGGVLPLERSA